MKLLLFVLLLRLQAYADYPSARLNQNVCEEISGQSYRLLSRKDWFCGAVDGQAYARTIGKRDYYHGVGHWTQVRTEFRWEESVAINFRSILYSATSSSGYADSNEDYHLASFRFIYPEKILGAFLTLRIVDLDRQSVGEGLFIEARESNGGLMLWDWDNVQFRWLQESTGFLVGDDDVSNPEINFWERRLGLGALWFYEQPFQDKRVPYYYLYSNIPYESWTFSAEAGARNGTLAYLGKISHELLAGGFTMETILQGRYYPNGFAQGFAGQIEQQYVSYDQYNKYYTNSINVFARAGHATVSSLVLNFRYEFSHAHRMGWLNEVGMFDFVGAEDDRFYFGRLEYNHYPFPLREDYFSFFATNKLLRDSYNAPPNFESLTSDPLFRNYGYFGIEGNFQF
jgi:hypothetical protein